MLRLPRATFSIFGNIFEKNVLSCVKYHDFRVPNRPWARRLHFFRKESAFFSKILSKIEKVARGSYNTSHVLALQEGLKDLSINPRENNQNEKIKFSELAGQIRH